MSDVVMWRYIEAHTHTHISDKQPSNFCRSNSLTIISQPQATAEDTLPKVQLVEQKPRSLCYKANSVATHPYLQQQLISLIQ